MTDERTPGLIRAVTREISIAAPVDAVWRALTDAEELTRWFPPEARVEPGVGGRFLRRWQSGESITERIERWEPNVHLRTTGLDGVWNGIVTDYHLTTRGGDTVLRVVSSGFGTDADWDALYDAFGGGWDFELYGLKHYLERHRGTPRCIVFVRAPRPASPLESWRRMIGPGRCLQLDTEVLRSGESFQGTFASGQRVSGTVVLYDPPRQLAVTVRELNDAYLRIDTRCVGDEGIALVWLSTYGIPAAAIRETERAWQNVIDAAFLENQPITA